MFDHQCSVCVLFDRNTGLANELERRYDGGTSLHALHRRAEHVLGAKSPSRSAFFRHFNGDSSYMPHVPRERRDAHERARLRAGHEVHGAAAASVKMSRSRPRGSARLVEQVARLLVERNLIPRAVFDEVGLDVPGAPPLAAAMYLTPEERSIAQGWGRR